MYQSNISSAVCEGRFRLHDLLELKQQAFDRFKARNLHTCCSGLTGAAAFMHVRQTHTRVADELVSVLSVQRDAQSGTQASFAAGGGTQNCADVRQYPNRHMLLHNSTAGPIVSGSDQRFWIAEFTPEQRYLPRI